MPEPTGAWGAWTASTRNDPYPLFESMRAECPVRRVRLADGHDAWVVLGHGAARQALKDGRALQGHGRRARPRSRHRRCRGLPGPAFARHMLNGRPPRPHPAAPAGVAGVRADADRRARSRPIERIADTLLDELGAARARDGGRPHRGFRPPVAVPGDLRAARRSRQGSGRPAPAVPDTVPAVERVTRRPRRSRRPRPSSVYSSGSSLTSVTISQDDLVGVLVTASDDDERLTERNCSPACSS